MTATAIILAAGLGTRMKSRLPKALHPIAGRPMLRHLIASCEAVFDRIVVVVGPEMEAVAALAAPHAVVVQQDRLGTAHAALQALPHVRRGRGRGAVCRQPADPPGTLHAPARAARRDGDAGLALLAMRPADPGRYGRVDHRRTATSRASSNGPMRTRRNARDDAVQCRRALRRRRPISRAGCAPCATTTRRREYYLTDVVALAVARGRARRRASRRRTTSCAASIRAPSWPRRRRRCSAGCARERWRRASP